MKHTVIIKRLSDERLDEIRSILNSPLCTEEDRREIIDDMAYHQCTQLEICSVMGFTKNYIEDRYRDILNAASARFKHDLRRLQVGNAAHNTGNASMLIWLGKQYLEQSDMPHMEIKKDQFDEFISWIATQKTQSSPPAPSK